MRKLKLLLQTTINGYAAGPNGENDWMTWNPDAELIEFMNSLYDSSDTILLGRKTADFFIDYWKGAFDKNPDTPFAKQIVEMPKVVFTKTLAHSKWDNTTLAKGNLSEEIGGLKKQNGKDIMVIGSPTFVSSLIKESLIDEYQLIINPTAMASGMTIFNSLDGIRKFIPVQSKLYPGEKIVMTYKSKND